MSYLPDSSNRHSMCYLTVFRHIILWFGGGFIVLYVLYKIRVERYKYLFKEKVLNPTDDEEDKFLWDDVCKCLNKPFLP